MRRTSDRVAGIDVHRDVVAASTQVVESGRVVADRQRFRHHPGRAGELAEWLVEHRVRLVAMDATGLHWKLVHYALEGMFDELWLCNAHHVNNVPGRKTDVSDGEWLADVAAHGMVRPSFVLPPGAGADPLRQDPDRRADARAKEIQRREKVVQDVEIEPSSVASAGASREGRW